MRGFEILALATGALGARIVMGNDDGWAELYVRSFYDALGASGHERVLSCPAENKSGSSSSDEDPTIRTEPCQYNSCEPGAKVGNNATDPHLNWVNSFPVTAMKRGLEEFAPVYFTTGDKMAQLAVTGPNVGSNRWLQVPFSGTVGAAVEASKQGYPAIAFSGSTGGTLAWNISPVPKKSLFYAELATFLVNEVVEAGGKFDGPWLPHHTFLNVNLPEVQDGSCDSLSHVKWVVTRINPWLFSAPDAVVCGSDRLKTEFDVFASGKCIVSVSVGDAMDKTTADAGRQEEVLKRIGHIFTCDW